jgi:hypothetical protein
MIDDHPPHGEDQVSGVGFPRTGLNAKSAVEAAPEIFIIFQDSLLGPDLGVADHFPREMFVQERADGRAGTTVETIHGGIDAKTGQLVNKFRFYLDHGLFLLVGNIRLLRDGALLNRRIPK